MEPMKLALLVVSMTGPVGDRSDASVLYASAYYISKSRINRTLFLLPLQAMINLGKGGNERAHRLRDQHLPIA